MDRTSAVGGMAKPAHRSFGLTRRLSLALVVSLFAAVWVVGPAAAARPYIERGFVDGPHIDVIDCGGFTATLVRNFTGTNYYFVDAQDNLVRAVTNAKMVGSLTSSAGLVVNLRVDRRQRAATDRSALGTISRRCSRC